MKRTILFLLISITLTFRIHSQAYNGPAVEHVFACTDYTRGLVCIISEKGKLLWQYPAENCNDLWVLSNGNLLFNTGKGDFTNWLGHNQFGTAPHAFEITPDKKIVWIFNDHSMLKTMSNIQVLDTNGDPLKGIILH